MVFLFCLNAEFRHGSLEETTAAERSAGEQVYSALARG